MRFAAVIAAAGRSTNYGKKQKLFELLDGIPVITYSVKLFLSMPNCAAVVLVVQSQAEAKVKEILGSDLVMAAGPRLIFTEGGDSRAESVKAGLLALRTVDPEVVLIHDAARPFLTKELTERVLKEAFATGASVPGLPVTDTVKMVSSDNSITNHLERSSLRAVQTPQGFIYRGILSAYLSGGTDISKATDDTEIWAKVGGSVVVVEGDRNNRKIKFPEDLVSN